MAEEQDKKNPSASSPPPENSPAGAGIGASDGPVDIDAMEVKILIIASVPSQFHSVSSFLSRRGWPTEVTGAINEALQVLSGEKPDFVLLSVNLNSPKLAMLPSLLAQTFNTTCIGFAEKTDHKSIGKLNQLKVRHKMMGPVSGPSIHRKIKKILSEMYGLDKEDSAANSNEELAKKAEDSGGESRFTSTSKNKEDGNDVIRFKNDGSQNGFVQVKGKSGRPRPTLLNRQGNKEADPDAIRKFQEALMGAGEDSANVSGGNFANHDNWNLQEGENFDAADLDSTVQKGTKSEMKSSLDLRQGESKDADSQWAKGKGRKKSGSLFAEGEVDENGHLHEEGLESEGKNLFAKGQKGKGLFDLQKGEAEEDGDLSLSEAEREEKRRRRQAETQAHGVNQKAKGRSSSETDEGANRESGEASAEFLQPGDYASKKKAGITSDEAESEISDLDALAAQIAEQSNLKNKKADENILSEAEKLKKRLADEARWAEGEGVEKAQEKNSLPVEQTNIFEAVKKALNEICDEPSQKIQHLTNVDYLGVVPVESNQLKGYFLLATSLGLGQLKLLSKNFSKHLSDHLKKLNINFEFKTELITRVRTLPFQSWALDKLPIYFQRETGVGEIAVTFLAAERLLPEYQPAQDKSKVAIPVNVIDERFPVTFKAYLYLPENKKYFCYLNEGSRLSEMRRDRLLERKAELFISAQDLEKFFAYFVEMHVERARESSSEPTSSQKAS